LNPGVGNTSPKFSSYSTYSTPFKNFNGELVFIADIDDTQNYRLLKVNNGTGQVDTLDNEASGYKETFAVLGDKIYYAGNSVNEGWELYKHDGASRTLVSDIYAGPLGSEPCYLTPFNGKLFFATRRDDGIWIHDPSDNTTVQLVSGNNFGRIIVAEDKLFFYSGDGNTLWVSDGTVAGTSSLISIGSGLPPNFQSSASAIDDRLLFPIGAEGRADLWVSDGTVNGTFKIREFSSNSVDEITAFGGKGYFAGIDDVNGLKYWETDGTVEGTRILDIELVTSPVLAVGDDRMILKGADPNYWPIYYQLEPNGKLTEIIFDD